MKIECFLAEGCGSKEQLRENIQKALFNAGFNKVIKRGFRQSDYEALKIDYRTDDQINGHLTLYVDAIKG